MKKYVTPEIETIKIMAPVILDGSPVDEGFDVDLDAGDL